jgi:hypothetical protein
MDRSGKFSAHQKNILFPFKLSLPANGSVDVRRLAPMNGRLPNKIKM